MQRFLDKNVYQELTGLKPDLIISCGSSLAAVNYLLGRHNLASSIVLMRPSVLSMKRFDLVVMPRHDGPPKRKNVVTIDGALTSLGPVGLEAESEKLMHEAGIKLNVQDKYIGLLIGGSTKNFDLSRKLISEVIPRIKESAVKLNAGILATTSRRTSPQIEDLLKRTLGGEAFCKLLVIANEKNYPSTVSGILGLSNIVVLSPESISMISEAASCGRQVCVLKAKIDHRHNIFLKYMARRGYIHLIEPGRLSSVLDSIGHKQPETKVLNNRDVIKEALKRIF